MNLASIWNTPGYYYGIGYALATFVVVGQLSRRARLRDRAMGFGLLALVLVGFMLLTPGADGLYYVACMLFIVAFMVVSLFQVTRDWVKAGFYGVKSFIYGEFISSLTWQLYYYVGLRWTRLQTPAGSLAVMAPIYLALAALAWALERTLHRGGAEAEIRPRELGIAFITGIAAFVGSNLGYVDPGGMFSGSFARDVFAIRTLMDLSGVAMLYAFHSQLLELQLRLEKEALNNIMQTQYQAYRLSRESMELTDQKYHDLKHQIALLKAGAGTDRQAAWLKEMEAELRRIAPRYRTGSPVLDAILTTKSASCAREGVELKVIADGALLNFMTDMEVSALFGNMLDNAIEAVERVPEPERRVIRLRVDAEKRFLRIRIENRCAGTLTFRDGLPVTTTQDARSHGFGMKSMQRTVAKYGGSMLAGQRDDWFELNILVPMEQS